MMNYSITVNALSLRRNFVEVGIYSVHILSIYNQGYSEDEDEEDGAKEAAEDGHPCLCCQLLSVYLHTSKQQYRHSTG